MDDEGATPVTDPTRAPKGIAEAVPPSTWVGVTLIGAVLFGLGIWTPAWKGVNGGYPLSLLVAAVGGVLFLVGITYAWQGFQRTRPRSAVQMPGVEVFTPQTAGRVRAADATADEDPH